VRRAPKDGTGTASTVTATPPVVGAGEGGFIAHRLWARFVSTSTPSKSNCPLALLPSAMRSRVISIRASVVGLDSRFVYHTRSNAGAHTGGWCELVTGAGFHRHEFRLALRSVRQHECSCRTHAEHTLEASTSILTMVLTMAWCLALASPCIAPSRLSPSAPDRLKFTVAHPHCMPPGHSHRERHGTPHRNVWRQCLLDGRPRRVWIA